MLTRAAAGNCPVNFTFPTTEAPEPVSGLAAPELAPAGAPKERSLPTTNMAKPAISVRNNFDFMTVDSSRGPETRVSVSGEKV